MGDRLRTGKPSRYVTSHPGQLSLAIPTCVGEMSTSESWAVNGHTARYTSPISVVSQCKLVLGWGLRKRRLAPPHGPYGSGMTLLSTLSPYNSKIPNFPGLNQSKSINQKLFVTRAASCTELESEAQRARVQKTPPLINKQPDNLKSSYNVVPQKQYVENLHS